MSIVLNMFVFVKVLFDPINPDKDTLSTRNLSRKERLDNEFWLLNRLASVMSKANFNELDRETIEKAMKEHEAYEGVLVSVFAKSHAVLRNTLMVFNNFK